MATHEVFNQATPLADVLERVGAGALARQRIRKGAIGCKEIDVDKRRRLVEDFMRGHAGNLLPAW